MIQFRQSARPTTTPAAVCRILLGIVLFSSVALAAGSLSSEVTFHASFDSDFNADKAKGGPTVKVVGRVEQMHGLRGSAVIVGPKGWLEYALEDNINKAGGNGSIEMWIKPLDWDGTEPKEATFFTAEYENEGKAPDLIGLFRLYSLPGVARLTFIGGPYPDDKPDRRVTLQSEIKDWQRGQWHHIAVTWDGYSLVLYIDGELKGRQAIRVMSGSGENPRFVPALGSVFTVGGKPWGEGGETAIDEVTIYKSALLPEDVMQQFRRFAETKGSLVAPTTPQTKPAAPTAKQLPQVAPSALADTPARVGIAVPIIRNKPSVDGVLDEKEWSGASTANCFVEILKPEVRLGRYDNRFYVSVSDQVLYLGLLSEFRGGVRPTAEAQSNSGNIFNDDCFEIHFSSPGNPDRVYKYDVNSAGRLDHYDSKPKFELIPTKALSAARVMSNHWTAELAIPLEEIGVTRPASPGDRLLIQVVRSYKEGSVAHRSNAARSISDKAPLEEYVGFPWNSSFLNTDNYAELRLVDERHFVRLRVDAGAYFGKGELVLQGSLGPAWPSVARSGLLTAYASGKESTPDQVAVQPNGSFSQTRALPDKAGEAVLSFAEGLCLKLPLHRTTPALHINHTIFSHSNNLQVALDISDLTSLKPADVRGEVLIKDRHGKVLVQEEVRSFTRTEERRALSIAALAAGKYAIECHVKDHSGKLVATASQSFEVFRKLPGEGRRLGITDQVPTPWSPVEVGKKNRISVWGRVYDFGANLLPQQVVILGKPILSAPIAYEIQLSGAPSSLVRNGTVRIVEQKPAKVILHGVHRSDNLEIKHTVTIEFDGMIRCDAEITASKPIQRLALRMPVREDRARLFHAAAWRGKFTPQLWSPIEMGPDFHWSSLYLYPVMWVADMQGGLCWFAASDRTWVVDRKRDKLVVDKEGMRVSLVDTDSPGTTHLKFTYGLQAFPTKPARPDWREFGRVLEGKWQSVFTPDPTTEQQKDGLVPETYFRELMRGSNKRVVRAAMLPFGNFPRSVKDYTSLAPEVYAFATKRLDQELKRLRGMGIEYVAPYLTPTYCSDAIPEWKFYWSNWTIIPKARFDADGESGVCVANAQWRDFWLQSFHDYVKKYGIKAVFHDMAGPYAEEGTLNGLGYTRNGVRYPEYPIWECREIFKRTYITHRQLFPDAMSFMNYGDFTPPVHSFADFLLAAERYETRADRSIYDFDGDGNIASFTYQTSLLFGPKAMHNGWLKYKYAMDEKEPTVHMYGLVLLHDLVQWNINENPEIRAAVHTLKKRFGIGYDRDIVFLPYWENTDKYRVDSKDIVISFYQKDSRLLAIIVNKSMKIPFQGTVELSTKALGINSVQSVEVYDPLANTHDSVKDEDTDEKLLLRMEIKPTLFKAVLVN